VFLVASAAALAVVAGVATVWPPVLWSLLVLLPLSARGVADMVQTKQAIRRNFPLLGHGRYLLEQLRPEINQYFVESNSDGKPFSRNDRSVVYQRAKGELDTLPFGTQHDVYDEGYEFMVHSILSRPPLPEVPRVERSHKETVESLLELIGAAGVSHPSEIGPEHVWRRTSPTRVRSYAEIYPFPDPGSLIEPPIPEPYARFWTGVRADSFA
jgi:hypothetical protein